MTEDIREQVEKRRQAIEAGIQKLKDSGGKQSENEIREQVKIRQQEEAEARNLNQIEGSAEYEITPALVRKLLGQNEVGWGILYALLNPDVRFNVTDGYFYTWEEHAWEKDIWGKAETFVENVCSRLLKEAKRISQSKDETDPEKSKEEIKVLESIFKCVHKLRSVRGLKNCLNCAKAFRAKNNMTISSDDFDQNPWLLGCANGVIDLRTGILLPGRREDFIHRRSKIKFLGINEPAPAWEKFLYEIFNGDQSLIDYFQRFIGYSITGFTRERKILLLYGPRGNNGKTVLIEIILYVLGLLAASIQSEVLLDQGRSRSAASASPDIVAFKGLRLAVCSETDENRHFSPSRVKLLTGSDSLAGRSPFDKADTVFKPSHQLVLLSNSKPHAPSHDQAFWERVAIIPFLISFVLREPECEHERRADPEIDLKLKAEAPGILAWLVRGCIRWQEQGLDPPPIILDAVKQYRREEDLLADYIEDCCYKDPKAFVSAANLYDSFTAWYTINISLKPMSQKRFGTLLVKAGFKKEKVGTVKYFGIGLLEEDN